MNSSRLGFVCTNSARLVIEMLTVAFFVRMLRRLASASHTTVTMSFASLDIYFYVLDIFSSLLVI